MSFKYLILIGDGMADRPLSRLQNRTPLQVAETPYLDALACSGSLGLARTIPPGFAPGSDIANLTILGYPSAEFYTGRSPLEAAGMGVELAADDVAFRCNLVSLSGEGTQRSMSDFSAGHIDTTTARELIAVLNEKLGGERLRFHAGVSYRHLLVWRGGETGINTTPPHDISGRRIAAHLPQGPGSGFLIELMQHAQEILSDHPLNRQRQAQGRPAANGIWLWGQGKAPRLPSLQERYQLKGALISAVDLLKGIGNYLKMTIIDVPGATGYLDTNYRGKAEAALQALREHDFVYLHLEAPDEAAHNGDLAAKIEAIEAFDRKILGPVWEGLKKRGRYRLLVLPDHATPLSTRTHSGDPVPFAIYPAPVSGKTAAVFSESAAQNTNWLLEDGCRLIEYLLWR